METRFYFEFRSTDGLLNASDIISEDIELQYIIAKAPSTISVSCVPAIVIKHTKDAVSAANMLKTTGIYHTIAVVKCDPANHIYKMADKYLPGLYHIENFISKYRESE